MKTKFSHIIREKPFFLFLLPVFFVWHGYVDFYDLISPSKALLLILYYLIGTVVVFLISWLFLKNKGKAALYSFSLMCLYFFFGGVQDFLQKKFPGAFINKYSFLLSALLIIFLLLFIVLKKYKKQMTKIFTYLNALILVLILFDIGLFFKKNFTNYNILTVNKPPVFESCKNCSKPDIYLIIADGYPGKIPMLRFMNYNNGSFEDQLRKRKFFIIDSTSANYNSTIFSIGSLLNMDYLKTSNFFYGKKDLPIAFHSIRHNRIMKFFTKENYEIFNYSIFDIDRHPPIVKNILTNFEQSPITTQPFLYRLNRDIGYHLLTTLKLKFLENETKNDLFNNLNNNIRIDSLTKDVTTTKSLQPKLVYTHLVMPHLPYYFDSLGNRIPEIMFTHAFNADKKAFISYLKYTNKKLLELVDFIQANNSRPAIIVLMGDHGFREIDEKKAEYFTKYQFMNLNAVFFPDQNYREFYKGMSNVNQFRVILNSQFHQRLNLLKDSDINIQQ